MSPADRAEIERAPPDERADRVEELPAECDVARCGARADEGGTLPGERLRLVIADRRIDRQRDRRDLGRRPQAEVDAQHIAVAVTCLEQFDDALADPHGGGFGFLARAERQGVRIVDQDRIDIRRIIEFATPLFAKRDRGEPARFGAGRALFDRGADRGVECVVGKPGELLRHGGEIEHAGQVTDRDPQRERTPFEAEASCDRHVEVERSRDRIQPPLCQLRGKHRLAVEEHGEEGGPASRALRCGDDVRRPMRVIHATPHNSFIKSSQGSNKSS